MNEHDESIINLPVDPATMVPSGVFLSVDVEGDIRPLVPGEPFCGVSARARQLGDQFTSVLVSTEGRIEIPVDGLKPNSIGQPVFATGPSKGMLDRKAAGTKIGRVLKQVRPGVALIKYEV